MFTIGSGQEISFKDHLIQDHSSNISIEFGFFDVLQDRRGWLWITAFEGIARCDGNRCRIYKYDPGDSTSLIANAVPVIYEDSLGNIWLGTTGGGLEKYDPVTDRFSHYQSEPNNPNSLSSNRVFSLMEDNLGNIWVGTDRGLNVLDPNTQKFRRFPVEDSESVNRQVALSLVEDKKQHVWIGTMRHGLKRFDPGVEKFKSFVHDPKDPSSLRSNTINSLHIDRHKQLWVGTSKGLHKYDPADEAFLYFPISSPSARTEVITDIIEDKDGFLWLATQSGIVRFDPLSQESAVYFPEPELAKSDQWELANHVNFIYQDREGTFWLGTRNGKLLSFTWEKAKGRRYQYEPDNPYSINGRYLNGVHKDDQGTYWLATEEGLCSFDPETQRFVNYMPGSSANGQSFLQIFEDANQDLWFASKGLARFDKATGSFQIYRHDPNDSQSISSNEIRSFFQDSKGRLWIGTFDGGLCLYDPVHDHFEQYWSRPNGSQGDNTVFAIRQ